MILNFTVDKPIDLVYDHLTDMQKFVSIHPIIYKIENKGADNYLVFETLKVLFIPISFTYPVKVAADKQKNEVIINAVVKKMTHVQMHFVLKNENGKTSVTETIDFRSPLPVKAILEKIFSKQHADLFKNMNAL